MTICSLSAHQDPEVRSVGMRAAAFLGGAKAKFCRSLMRPLPFASTATCSAESKASTLAFQPWVALKARGEGLCYTGAC